MLRSNILETQRNQIVVKILFCQNKIFDIARKSSLACLKIDQITRT